MLKFRVWLGSKILSIGLRVCGLGKTKWQSVSLIGEAPEITPIVDELERIRSENQRLQSEVDRLKRIVKYGFDAK